MSLVLLASEHQTGHDPPVVTSGGAAVEPERRRPEIGDWNSFAELRDLQRKQLAEVLTWAGRSPFYSARSGPGEMPLSVDDFDRLPVTSKQDLRDAYPFGLLAVERAELATYHESSGTAGQATSSYFTDADWEDLAERYARKHVPLSRDDTFLVRTPYALMITGHLAQAAGRLRGATVVPADYRSAAMPYSRVVGLLHDLEVTRTWSIPTEPLVWAAAARQAGLRPDHDFPSLAALYVAGEPLTAARRRRLSDLWGGVAIVEEYGSTETGTLGGECPHGRLHLWADRLLVEVRDPDTGEVRPEGRGHLVVTPLYREAMPLLRYDLEDDVVVEHADCPCGWHLPSVTVLGRSALQHPVGDGSVTQQQLEQVVYELPIALDVLFWRGRAERDVLRLQVEAPVEHHREVRRRLVARVRDEVGVPVDVQVLDPGGLVPLADLSVSRNVVKPRTLLAADEDWDQARLHN